MDLKPNFNSTVDPERAGELGFDHDAINPYKVFIYKDFLPENQYKSLLVEAKKIPLEPNYSDLFHFLQSKDIGKNQRKNGPLLKKFIAMMRGQVRDHLRSRAQIELDDPAPFDITVSRYETFDYLLCHNDHSPDMDVSHRRAMAFIYYLTNSEMHLGDGGALSLYGVDQLNQPNRVVQKIYPKPNMLLVFPTSDTSWHSVDEVISNKHDRLSINGWFNSTKLPKLAQPQENYMEPCPYYFYAPVNLTPFDVTEAEMLINDFYLKPQFLKQAVKEYRKEHMLKLAHFLRPEVYKAIASDLRKICRNSTNLSLIGPFNKRNYSVVYADKLSKLTILVHRFFRSHTFMCLLSKMTGIEFKTATTNIKPNPKIKKNFEKLLSPDLSISNSHQNNINPADDHDFIESTGYRVGASIASGPNYDEAENIKILDEQHDLKYIENVLKDCELSTKPGGSPKKSRKEGAEQLVRLEYRHYEQGSYTIMNDEAFELFESNVLDLILPFNSYIYNRDDFGGYHSYLEREPDSETGQMNEAVEVLADPNSLNLIDRKDNMRFFRYITHHIPLKDKSSFQELNGVYYNKVELIPGNKQ